MLLENEKRCTLQDPRGIISTFLSPQVTLMDLIGSPGKYSWWEMCHIFIRCNKVFPRDIIAVLNSGYSYTFIQVSTM